MAQVRKLYKSYYAYVSCTDSFGNQKKVSVPLETKLKTEAEERLADVEKVETTIKEQGSWKTPKRIEFKWMGNNKHTAIKAVSIEEAFEEYKTILRINNCRPKTIMAYEYALTSFSEIHLLSEEVRSLTDSHIEEWKKYSQAIHSPQTTNMYLAKLKTLFKHCFRKGYLVKELFIEMVRTNEEPPMYLSDEKIQALMLSDIDDHWKRAFLFYIATGCRLQEPFNGTLDGKWLKIKAESSKGRKQRNVELNPLLVQILKEMLKRYDSKIGTSANGSWSVSHNGIIDTYSKLFKKTAKQLGFGEHKFHNLRDTYAVRRWAECGDIFLVCKEIGHSKVSQTEKYAQFEIEMLRDDFPSLRHKIDLRMKKDDHIKAIESLGQSVLKSLPINA